MTPDQVKRKLAAILSADVQGYSRLMEEDEEGTIRTLKAYMEVINGFIQQHRGRLVATGGDSVLAEFASVVDAVRCAVGIQEELKERNKDVAENRRMEFRIGVNLGDVVEEGDTILGDGVNIAARVQSLAEAGGICITGTAYDQIKNKLALGYEYVGEQTVKNIKEPVKVYRVLMEPGVQMPAGGVEVASKEKMAFPLPDKPSIAVLPFVNMSKDPKSGVLQRRDHRGHHHRPFQDTKAVCDRPQLHLYLQGKTGQGQAGERRTWGSLCAGGQCSEVRRPGSDYRPIDRCPQRVSPLGRALRS